MKLWRGTLIKKVNELESLITTSGVFINFSLTYLADYVLKYKLGYTPQP